MSIQSIITWAFLLIILGVIIFFGYYIVLAINNNNDTLTKLNNTIQKKYKKKQDKDNFVDFSDFKDIPDHQFLPPSQLNFESSNQNAKNAMGLFENVGQKKPKYELPKLITNEAKPKVITPSVSADPLENLEQIQLEQNRKHRMYEKEKEKIRLDWDEK